MQFAKDSFYMTLRARLAAINPQRVATLDGVTRPALIVAENELVLPVEPMPDAFYLEWGAASALPQQSGSRALMGMDCVISYHTLGSCESGVDRGRVLAALDTELQSICQPPNTGKRDYTKSPSADLGTCLFWAAPDLGEVSGSQGPRHATLPGKSGSVCLERKARLKVFFFAEVNLR